MNAPARPVTWFDIEVTIPVRVKRTDLGDCIDSEAFLPDGTPIYVETFGDEGPGIFAIIDELVEDDDHG